MTDEQAKNLMDTLHYLSGQLQGFAVLSIAGSANHRFAVSNEEAMQELIKAAGPTADSDPAWRKGFEAVTTLCPRSLSNNSFLETKIATQ